MHALYNQFRSWRIGAFLIAGLSFVSFETPSLFAQQRPPSRPGSEFGDRNSKQGYINGTIHSFVPNRNVVRVIADDQHKFEAHVTNKTRVFVNGEGGADLLQPGMFVQFYAKLTRAGKGVEPIDKIVVVTPDQTFRPGAIEEKSRRDNDGDSPDGADAKNALEVNAAESKDTADAEADGSKTGAADKDAAPDKKDGSDATNDRKPQSDADEPTDDAEADDEDDDDDVKTKRKTRRTSSRSAAAKRYWVSGQVRSVKKGAVQIAAGETTARVEVDASTIVVLESNDLRMARPNDRVSIRCTLYADRPNDAKAHEIKVTLMREKPVDVETDSRPEPRAGSRTKRKTADAENDG